MIYDEDETSLIRQAKADGVDLTAEQVQWRRMKIADIGIVIFRQEYPSTSEEAVQGAKDLILPGLRDCVIDKLPFRGFGQTEECKVGGADFGFNDATAILTGYFVDQVMYVSRLYRETKAIASQHVQGVEQAHTYYCDPAATGARNELAAEAGRRHMDVHFVPAPRSKSLTAVNFVNDEWEMVRKLIVEQRLCLLPEPAKQLIYEADNLFWHPKTGLPDMRRDDAGIEGWGHFDCLDALRYMAMGCRSAGWIVPRETRRAMTRREAFRI